MMLEENQEQWLHALNIIANHHGHRTWDEGQVKYRVTEERVTQYVERIVCVQHRDEVFVREQLEAGAIPSKLHTEFFEEVKFSAFLK